MHQLCRACVFAKRIAARHTQIEQPLVLKQQKQESLTCFIRFYLTVPDLFFILRRVILVTYVIGYARKVKYFRSYYVLARNRLT